jgi:hypothetical protein
MELVVSPSGQVRCRYAEAIDLATLGQLHIVRASHVEPDQDGRWWVDLAPLRGPRLGPFQRRSAALQAETDWIGTYLFDLPPAAAASNPLLDDRLGPEQG